MGDPHDAEFDWAALTAAAVDVSARAYAPYSRFPVEATGFDKSSTGTLPRPVIKASNVAGILAGQARLYRPL